MPRSSPLFRGFRSGRRRRRVISSRTGSLGPPRRPRGPTMGPLEPAGTWPSAPKSPPDGCETKLRYDGASCGKTDAPPSRLFDLRLLRRALVDAVRDALLPVLPSGTNHFAVGDETPTSNSACDLHEQQISAPAQWGSECARAPTRRASRPPRASRSPSASRGASSVRGSRTIPSAGRYRIAAELSRARAPGRALDRRRARRSRRAPCRGRRGRGWIRRASPRSRASPASRARRRRPARCPSR